MSEVMEINRSENSLAHFKSPKPYISTLESFQFAPTLPQEHSQERQREIGNIGIFHVFRKLKYHFIFHFPA